MHNDPRRHAGDLADYLEAASLWLNRKLDGRPKEQLHHLHLGIDETENLAEGLRNCAQTVRLLPWLSELKQTTEKLR